MEIFDAKLIQALVNSPLVTVLEFFTITFIIAGTYFAIHRAFKHVQPSTKVMLSMLVGTVTYTMSKVVIVAMFLDPLLESTYIQPF